LYGDDEGPISSGMDSTLVNSGGNGTILSNIPGGYANERQSPGNDLDQLVAEVVVQDSVEPVPGVPHFYNSRAQAGLAPPKVRKRRRTYSSASSESYDSDEERGAEKRMQIEAISDEDWPLMLLRTPQKWATTEALQAMVRTQRPSQQNIPKQPDLSSAKKRKVGTGETAALWAHIKTSNKSLGQSSSQSQALQSATTHSTQSRQIRPPTTQIPVSKQGERIQVRRTTLGRAPRPPGTIVRRPD
jgi:hypothetical protein